MIVIDGRQTGLSVNNFTNLEELLVKVMEDGELENRIVTDVLVNQQNFTEIYPHQAEDIEARDITSVEVVSMPLADMAVNITRELYKVVTLMDEGARHVAGLFRQADDGEALELFQDLLDVTRDFLGMIGVLREEFDLGDNEDWILLADLLEYEFIPSAERWKKVIAKVREDIRVHGKD